MFILVNKNGVPLNGFFFASLEEATKVALTFVKNKQINEVFICTPVRRVALPPQDIIIEDLLQT